jgi:hypothetical protein
MPDPRITTRFATMDKLDVAAQSDECSGGNALWMTTGSTERPAIDDEALTRRFLLEAFSGKASRDVKRALVEERVTLLPRQQDADLASHCRAKPETGSRTEPKADADGDRFTAQWTSDQDSAIDQSGTEDDAIACAEREAAGCQRTRHLHDLELRAENCVAQVFDPCNVEPLP